MLTQCENFSRSRVAESAEVDGVMLDDVLVAREFYAYQVSAGGRGRHDHAGTHVRRGLLHHHVCRRDIRHGLEAQVARARGVVLDEEEAKVFTEDEVRALHPRLAVAVRGRVAVPLHRRVQRQQPRRFVARDLLGRALRGPELLEHDRLLEQVERGRRRPLAVCALEHHQGKRWERQRGDDHARERIQLANADKTLEGAVARDYRQGVCLV